MLMVSNSKHWGIENDYILFSIVISTQTSLKICNKALRMLVIKKILSLTYPSLFLIIAPMLEALKENNELTCAKIFELALELKLTPMAIADIANLRNMKIQRCQLGCF